MAENIFGVIAEFKTPAEIYHAAEKTRAEGYSEFDCYTPFPVHGLEKAMKLPASKVPWIVLAGGLTGFSLGILMQGYTSVGDRAWFMSLAGEDSALMWLYKVLVDLIGAGYPMIIGGKPFFSYQAYVPVTFELTILLSAFGAVFGMLALNRLPTWYHPAFKAPSFRRVTDDRFFLAIEAKDPRFDSAKVKSFLTELGGENVTVLEA